MLFLVCLDPLLNKKTTTQYQEHNNEEVNKFFINSSLDLLTLFNLFCRMKVKLIPNP